MARILVADDRASVCQTLEKVLQDERHTVVVAGTIDSATKLLRINRTSTPFEVAVVDLCFDNFTGPEPAKSEAGMLVVREALMDQFAEVIVLTAHGSTRTAAEACGIGVFRFLEKIGADDEIEPSGGLMDQIIATVSQAVEMRNKLVQLHKMLHSLQSILPEARRAGLDRHVADKGQQILASAQEIYNLLLRFRGKQV